MSATDTPLLAKHQLEKALYEEHKAVSSGRLKEENPLDTSPDFRRFCEACRRGDLRVAQEQITKGININARDEFDYTPLILASLCGHYEVVQMLLEQGALCERDTFQGERCLYNALNDRIRNLLLLYDYSKSTDPLQPLAAHITSLLTRDIPKTADIAVHTDRSTFDLHKFVLSARSPYFARKLAATPDVTSWKLSSSVPAQSFETCIRYLYLGDVGADLGDGEEEQAILTGINKLSRQLEIPQLFENVLQSGDRRQARQRRTEDIEKGRGQMAGWFRENVLSHKLDIDREKASAVKWDRSNAIFADVLLQADDDDEDDEEDVGDADEQDEEERRDPTSVGSSNGIPIGHFTPRNLQTPPKPTKRSTLYPAHRAMLLRSEVFATMFASPFREGQTGEHLQIVPVHCTPDVLEVILTFLYAEQVDFPLSLALDVLHAADMLFLEKLKQRAALLISTLGNGSASVVEATNPRGETDQEDAVNIFDIIRAGWDTRVPRLEEFGARFIADRLERFIDTPEFADLVRDSAARIKRREETDTVELVDDVRYYLSERFRLRFEDAGLDELMDENETGAEPDQLDLMRDGEAQLQGASQKQSPSDEEGEAYSGLHIPSEQALADATAVADAQGGLVVRTLDGEVAGDEFAQDAMNYRILLAKLEGLMEGLGLDG